MQTTEETIEVAVPVREAYEQRWLFESFPQFMSGVQSVRRVSDRITHWVTDIGGVEREFDAETVEDHRDERIAWRSTDGVSHAGARSFTPLGPPSTRIWVRLEWSPENQFREARGAWGCTRCVRASAKNPAYRRTLGLGRRGTARGSSSMSGTCHPRHTNLRVLRHAHRTDVAGGSMRSPALRPSTMSQASMLKLNGPARKLKPAKIPDNAAANPSAPVSIPQ